jgi:L-asparaginase/Glu-tRNA(Gln) amidotransferase subunit D
MDIGDSFFIPTLKSADAIYSAVEASKKHNLRVKAFAAMKDGIMGIRVWRVN